MSIVEIDEFHLVAIYVNDLAASQKFYEDVLGFTKRTNMGTGYIMSHDVAKLTIYVEGERTNRESSGTKFPMISFCLNAKFGVKNAMMAMETAGIPLVGTFGDFASDFAGFHFKDPSGNVLEIAGKP